MQSDSLSIKVIIHKYLDSCVTIHWAIIHISI